MWVGRLGTRLPPRALRALAVVTPACKLPVFLLHYVIAEKGVGHAIYGEEGRTVCRGISAGVKSRSVVLGYPS